MLNWIDKLPVVPLAVVSLLFAVLPFNATPHLLEKLDMLLQGTLVRPIDIFDLFLHGTPITLLVIRVVRMLQKR